MTSSCSEPGERLAAIRRRLGAPAAVCTLDAALPRLLVTEIVVRAPRPRLFEEVPDLPDRLRGAWGRALERLASTPRRDGWPAAWRLMFADAVAGAGAIRPYAIRADSDAARLVVSVRLFGFADLWLEEAQEALVGALRGGIALKQNGRHRVAFEVDDVAIVRRWGVALRDRPRVATVRLRTPLMLRHGGYYVGSLARLPGALARRLRALGAWNDLDIAIGRAAALDIVEDGTSVVRWTRHSASQPDGQALVGYVGELKVRIPDDATWKLLVAGEALHGGGHATGGFGRYELLPH